MKASDRSLPIHLRPPSAHTPGSFVCCAATALAAAGSGNTRTAPRQLHPPTTPGQDRPRGSTDGGRVRGDAGRRWPAADQARAVRDGEGGSGARAPGGDGGGPDTLRAPRPHLIGDRRDLSMALEYLYEAVGAPPFREMQERSGNPHALPISTLSRIVAREAAPTVPAAQTVRTVPRPHPHRLAPAQPLARPRRADPHRHAADCGHRADGLSGCRVTWPAGLRGSSARVGCVGGWWRGRGRCGAGSDRHLDPIAFSRLRSRSVTARVDPRRPGLLPPGVPWAPRGRVVLESPERFWPGSRLIRAP